jgi:hypothetical protein
MFAWRHPIEPGGLGESMLNARYFMAAGLALAAGAVAGTPAAHAGPAADQVAHAETQLLPAPGDPAAALQSFEQATDTFWKGLPLTFRTAVFASSITGFGQYAARPNTVFRPGEQSHVYLALAGYAFRPISSGFRIEFNSGVKIMTTSGGVIARNDDFAELIWERSAESHEFYADFPIPLPDLKPGSYTIELTVRDVQSGKMATVDLPFSIMPDLSGTPPGAAPLQ